jgi:hypothetical protein
MKWPWQRAEIQLDQPADVFWIVGGGQRQSFASVTDAVRFVMEELSEPHRVSAWITTADRSITSEQIVQLYEKR